MKQHNNFTPSNSTILQDLKTLTPESLYEQYGIHVEEDGTVWDSVEQRMFNNTTTWAEFIIDQEDDSHHAGFSKIGGKKYFDDDGY
jgi:hypothetical protein